MKYKLIEAAIRLGRKLWVLRHPIKAWKTRRAMGELQRKMDLCLWAARARITNVKLQFPGCEDAMNAWPPVNGVTTGYEVDGAVPTSIRWGTDGLLQSPAPSGGGYAVVNRMSEKELVDVSKWPNGTGVDVLRVRIKQGTSWAITVRDNATVTWPKIGQSVIVVDMQGSIGTLGLRYTATMVENDYEASLKQPGERTLLVEKLTLIETGAGSAQS